MQTKECRRCKKVIELNSKNFRPCGDGKYKNLYFRPYCRPCERKVIRSTQDPIKLKEKIKRYEKRYSLKFKLFVLEYKEKHPCVDCGENNPFLLEFDHISDKEREISDIKSFSMFNKEIKKCVVRCVSCHRLKTIKDHNHYSDYPEYLKKYLPPKF